MLNDVRNRESQFEHPCPRIREQGLDILQGLYWRSQNRSLLALQVVLDSVMASYSRDAAGASFDIDMFKVQHQYTHVSNSCVEAAMSRQHSKFKRIYSVWYKCHQD